MEEILALLMVWIRSNYLVNEAAATKIGYKEPVGKELTMWGDKGTIIGLMKDFHHNSLHVPIEPLILRLFKKSWTRKWLLGKCDRKN